MKINSDESGKPLLVNAFNLTSSSSTNVRHYPPWLGHISDLAAARSWSRGELEGVLPGWSLAQPRRRASWFAFSCVFLRQGTWFLWKIILIFHWLMIILKLMIGQEIYDPHAFVTWPLETYRNRRRGTNSGPLLVIGLTGHYCQHLVGHLPAIWYEFEVALFWSTYKDTSLQIFLRLVLYYHELLQTRT